MNVELTEDEVRLMKRLLKSNKEAWNSVLKKGKHITEGYALPTEVLKELGANDSVLKKLA